MPPTQADYDRIHVKIDEVSEATTQLNQDMDRTAELLLSGFGGSVPQKAA